jgi:hypothetical protein
MRLSRLQPDPSPLEMPTSLRSSPNQRAKYQARYSDTHLQCRLWEKYLSTWAEHKPDVPVGHTQHSHLDVVYDHDNLAPHEIQQLQVASATYEHVFKAAKGALPALANHPPVTVNFKEGGNMSLYLSPSGVLAPPPCSLVELERC